jgi:orotidine-5'-phosphate decarboxylase
MDASDIAELGYHNHSVEEVVFFRARKALEAGCDGVIASGLEAKKIKELTGNNRVLVMPSSAAIRAAISRCDGVAMASSPQTDFLVGETRSGRRDD